MPERQKVSKRVKQYWAGRKNSQQRSAIESAAIRLINQTPGFVVNDSYEPGGTLWQSPTTGEVGLNGISSGGRPLACHCWMPISRQIRRQSATRDRSS